MPVSPARRSRRTAPGWATSLPATGSSINKDNPELHDVYRLDLTDRSLTKVRVNPGFSSWLIDADLAVRGALAMTGDGGVRILLRDERTDEFTPWLTVPPEDAMTVQVDFSRDGRTLYLVSSAEANAGRLLAVNLATGARTVVVEDLAYDLDSVQWDQRTLRP